MFERRSLAGNRRLSITVYPSKVTLTEMEARLEAGYTLLPGQLLRFDGDNPVYGEVIRVEFLDDKDDSEFREGCLVVVKLLFGRPSMLPQAVSPLTDEELVQEVQRLQGQPENPLHLGEAFTGEFFRLGALTVIQGGDLILKYDALMMLLDAIEPYQRVLIVDPLGMFSETDKLGFYRAGQDMRLSIQEVGSKRFLTVLGDMFPEALQSQAQLELAEQLPLHNDFLPFREFVDDVASQNFKLRSLMILNLDATERAQVFADSEDQVLALNKMAGEHLNVLDLSFMPEPWKTLFYEEVCHEIFANAGGDLVPVLIYPENYLPKLEEWIQKADEAELNMVALTSPYCPELLEEMANNLLMAESRERLIMEGELTLGMPIGIPLAEARVLTRSEEEAQMHEAYQQAIQTPIVDLSSPPMERVAPAEVPDDHPAAAPQAVSYFNTEPQMQEESAPTASDEPFFADFTPEASLNYADAEEGALPAEEAPVYSGVYTLGQQQAPVEAPIGGMPEPGALEKDEFSFDPHLDQKPEEAWSAPGEAPPAVSPAISQSMAGFEQAPEETPLWQVEESASAKPEAGEPAETAIEFPSLEEMSPTAELENGMGTHAGPPPSPFEEEAVPLVQKPAEPLMSNPDGYQVGDTVRHDQYGVGTVNKVIPMDENVILNITFEQVGKRLLDPALCKLSKV